MDSVLGRRMIPHYSTAESCYLSQNNLVLRYDFATNEFTKVCTVGGSSQGVIGLVKEKILRNAFYRGFISKAFGLNHVCVAPNSHLIAIYDGLYWYDLNDNTAVARKVDAYKEMGLLPPLKSGIALHPNTGDFYFGEYINGVKKQVRICRISDKGRNIQVVYAFEPGVIQHVHGIYYDKYRDRFWVTTGDRDHECGIFYTDDLFNSLHKLGGGDQTWRAVSVVPTKDKLFWGMDAGKDAPASAVNRIFAFDLHAQARQEQAVIGNPAYHSVNSASGDIFMGVNFEPGRKQDTPESCGIWHGKFDGTRYLWRQLRDFPYKAGKVQGCSKYGYLYFPSGEVPNDCLIYAALNVSNRSFATYLLRF